MKSRPAISIILLLLSCLAMLGLAACTTTQSEPVRDPRTPSWLTPQTDNRLHPALPFPSSI